MAIRIESIDVISLQKMTTQRIPKRILPLVLIKVWKTKEKTYQINKSLFLVVRVESQRERKRSTQCLRCQCYGPNQTHYRMNVRCVKCSDNCRADECECLTKEPVLCARNHTLPNYRGIENDPTPKIPSKQNILVTPDRTFASSHINEVKIEVLVPKKGLRRQHQLRGPWRRPKNKHHKNFSYMRFLKF